MYLFIFCIYTTFVLFRLSILPKSKTAGNADLHILFLSKQYHVITLRQVHSLEEDGKPAPVCCLEVERGLENKYFIIATTRKRLFQFVGKVAEGSEQQGFSSIFNQNQDLLPSFQEFPANMGYSEITFYTSKLRTSPKAFAWMMGNGVLYGQLDYVRPDSLLSDVQVNVCVWENVLNVLIKFSSTLTSFLSLFHISSFTIK